MEMRAFTRLVWVVVLGCSACSARSLDYLSEHGDEPSLPDRKTHQTPGTEAAKPATSLPTEIVASDLEYPTLLTSNEDSLYWIEQSTKSIVTMKKTGGPREVVVQGADAAPVDFVVDPLPAGYVFWVDAANVLRGASKSLRNQTADVFIWKSTSPSLAVVSLAVDAHSVFAALHDATGKDPGGIVRFDRSNMVTPNDFVTGGFPRVIIAHDDRLFWFGQHLGGMNSGTAYSSKLDAPSAERYGAPEALDGVDKRRFAVSNDAVYAASDDELVRMPLVRDATPRSARTDGMAVKAIAVDDELVWICDASGRILRQRKDWTSTTPEVVVEGLGVPAAIAVDSDAIWFVTERSASVADGKLVKIPRSH